MVTSTPVRGFVQHALPLHAFRAAQREGSVMKTTVSRGGAVIIAVKDHVTNASSMVKLMKCVRLMVVVLCPAVHAIEYVFLTLKCCLHAMSTSLASVNNVILIFLNSVMEIVHSALSPSALIVVAMTTVTLSSTIVPLVGRRGAKNVQMSYTLYKPLALHIRHFVLHV